MSNEKKAKAKLESGMYECVHIGGVRDGKTDVYHSSTASTLQDKGLLKVGKRIDKYIPKTMKQ